MNNLIDMDFSNASCSKDIYPIVSIINDRFIDGDFDAVNELLSNIDFEKQNTLSLICFIRTTCCADKKLSNWKLLRDKIYNYIGPDRADSLMRGLM